MTWMIYGTTAKFPDDIVPSFPSDGTPVDDDAPPSFPVDDVTDIKVKAG